VGGA